MIHRPLLVLLFLPLVSMAGAQEPPSIERWDRVVCLQSENTAKPGTAQQCSAFLVNDGESLFVVTASHASEETHQKTRLIYRDAQGGSQWVALRMLFEPGKDPWLRYRNSDLAVARIDRVETAQNYIAQLTEIAIPLADISSEKQVRTTKIDLGGFPLGLGAENPISVIAVPGHIVSDEIMTDNRWGKEPIVYCSPAIAQGSSGGPAFLADQPATATTVVGMYIGIVFDVSGAKLSKLVPSRLIHAAIAEQARPSPDQ